MASQNAKSSVKKKVSHPEKYTLTTIAQYIAQKNELSQKQAKEILEDLFDVIGNGVLCGERVAVGKIGKIFVRVRPATKSRKGRNPLTGEEITIPAKKATKVPKFSFTKNFKEQALKARVKAK